MKLLRVQQRIHSLCQIAQEETLRKLRCRIMHKVKSICHRSIVLIKPVLF